MYKGFIKVYKHLYGKINDLLFKTKQTMQNLNELLQEKLTYKQYDELDLLLRVSPHRLTKIKNNPSIMEFDELGKISQLTGVAMTTLIDEYGCGTEGMSVAEFHQAMEKEGKA